MHPSNRQVQQYVHHLRELSREYIHTGPLSSPLILATSIRAGILDWMQLTINNYTIILTYLFRRMLYQALTAMVGTVLFTQS